jgi:molybdopterin molybdotransferase
MFVSGESSKRAKLLIIAAMALDSSTQRIVRLTPLDAVLALIETRVVAVKPRSCALGSVLGATLAEDVVASERPPHAIALRDGYAVEAAAITDSSSYAPAPFVAPPPQVDTGAPMPDGTDAVAPLDAVTMRGECAEAIAAVAPGEGVLPAGGDAPPRAVLRRAGDQMRALDIAVAASAGIANVTIRKPRLRVACGSARRTPLIDAALILLTQLVTKAGAVVVGDPGPFDAALADETADAVIGIGGTGAGSEDNSVLTVAKRGRVDVHGIAILPGETAAFGWSGARPVLLIPGRLDAVLAVWLLIGLPLIAKLAGGSVVDAPVMLPLKRKSASTIGLVELIPVRRANGMAEPLGSGYLSFAVLTGSDGFIVVPADSEGFAAGTQVAVRSWP